ncbi:acyl-CoA dehydrogenase family protein [Streptomyces griseoluteus]|uniref:acyl-CoA dehydrogenase family protein n=1 Tax=Streptomyces griseoluteus TaxID=29306 RepID=UPI0036EEED9D
MDFALTPEQEQLRKETDRFARSEFSRSVSDNGGSLFRERWQRFAKFGVQGMPFPTEYGGQGASLLTTVLMLEELGYGCPDSGFYTCVARMRDS